MAIRKSTTNTTTATPEVTTVKIENQQSTGEKMNTETQTNKPENNPAAPADALKAPVAKIRSVEEVLLKATGSNNLTERQMLNLRVKLTEAGFEVEGVGRGLECTGVTFQAIAKLTKILTGYIGWKLEVLLTTVDGKPVIEINRK